MAGSSRAKSLNNSKPRMDNARNHVDPSPSRRASRTAKYFAKTATGDYYCIVCKDHTPSRDFIIKKEKTGSKTKLWLHLKNAHAAIHQKIRGDTDQPSVADVQKQEFNMLILNLICGTNMTFNVIECPELKSSLSYFAQRKISLPSAEVIRIAALKKFEEGKSSLRQLLGPVRKVSLTMNTWSTENQVPVLGVTVHWIDNNWALCQRVLGVVEMDVCYMSDGMAEVLIQILEDFSLMDKVCAITMKNDSNNGKKVAALARALKDTEARFGKQYHMPCMTLIINLVVQEGFKQLDILRPPLIPQLIDEIFEDTDNPAQPSKTSTENTNSMLGTLIGQLRRAIIAIRGSRRMISLYKVLCKDLGMPDKKTLISDFPGEWDSTYEMLAAACRKRQVLDKMASGVMNTSENNLSITADEWEILKLFTRVLLPFHDCIEHLNGLKTVSASTALRILEALLNMVVSYLSDLEKVPSGTMDSTWSKELLATLRGTYTAMKEKLSKYDNSLKRSPTFAIAAALDPQMKLSYALPVKQEFVYENLLQLLKEVENETTSDQNATGHETVSGSITQSLLSDKLPDDHNLIEAAVRCSSLNAKRVKMSAREELDQYFGEARVNVDSLDWWRDIGCQRFPRLAVLAKEFLSICVTSTFFERMSAAGRSIIPCERESLDTESASAFMTLKSWAWEDDPVKITDEDEESDDEFGGLHV